MTTRKSCIVAAVLAAAGLARAADPAAPPPPAADGAPDAAAKKAAPREPEYEVKYLFNLSSSFGALPLSPVQMSYDRAHKELYVTGDGPVRVFNESGMEIYTFGDDADLGYVLSVAPTEEGEILALVRRDARAVIARCSFRGELRSLIEPRGVPDAYAGLVPNVMRYAAGKIYLANTTDMRILVLDATGEYVVAYDVAQKLGETARRGELGLRGFNVDREGNVLFTIQPLFQAYALSSDGELHPFGQRGSGPGKFNIVSGIARDDAGNYYVADILKSAVLVFDKGFVFRKEFGYRGMRPSSLAAPEDVAAAGTTLFVSNRARLGVKVFEVVAR